MALRQVSRLHAASPMLESRDTPMHVAALFEFSLPEAAPPAYLVNDVAAMRATRSIPPPWNLRLFDGPVIRTRPPLMHVIEVREHSRFGLHTKIIVDGASGMRMIMRASSIDHAETGAAPFSSVSAVAGRTPRRSRVG